MACWTTNSKQAIIAPMAALSIVIPTYNTAAMTLQCCRRAMAAMPEGTEIIVVDDGSCDGTAELLARDVPEVRVARLESNRGFAVAANHGVSATRGDIILLLNSDALVEADALRAFLDAFANEPRLGVAGAQLVNEDGSPQWSGGPTPTLLWMIGAVSGLGRYARFFRRRGSRDRREVDWVSGAAMAFRREVWNAAGPLDERYRFYCQDIDLCLNARDRGWNVRIVREARVVHALGATIGAAGRELAWRDLVTWGANRYGPRWARFARVVLQAAAMLR